jgi:hypothetical protein
MNLAADLPSGVIGILFFNDQQGIAFRFHTWNASARKGKPGERRSEG